MIRRCRNERAIFSRLATDIIHSIFGIALEVDQNHDPDLPPFRVKDQRDQLERMRLVSAGWNSFLLSSPRYWQVIDVTLPTKAITLAIERSGSVLLCVHYFFASSKTSFLHLVPAARVRTLRTYDADAYPPSRRFLQNPMPALQTLELRGLRGMTDDPSEPLGNLPSIHHFKAQWWELSPDAAYLIGLKELVWWRSRKSITEVLQVLSACASLERLEIYSEDEVVVGGLPGAIPLVTLPHLQSINLRFELNDSAEELIRRLIAPQCLRRTLLVARALGTGRFIADYRRFISLEDAGTRQCPKSANVRMQSTSSEVFEYRTENCKFIFEEASPEEIPAFHDLVQEFQNVLGGPSLEIMVNFPSENTWSFLKSLGDQNVQTIGAQLGYAFSLVYDLLGAIAAQPAGHSHMDGPVATNTTNDWPFKSLRCIYLYGPPVNLVEYTRKVEEYLHKDFKPLLEKIVLVRCRLEGMELTQAAERLAEIEITLQAMECYGGGRVRVSGGRVAGASW